MNECIYQVDEIWIRGMTQDRFGIWRHWMKLRDEYKPGYEPYVTDGRKRGWRLRTLSGK